MSESKTIPLFKILAALCLGIVCICEIVAMVNFADDYRAMTQKIDAEYLTIAYYIIGFSFLATAFAAVLKSGKRRFSVLAASIEFLIVLSIGLYFKEFFEITIKTDEITKSIIEIPKCYLDNAAILFIFSVLALVLSILDITIGHIFSSDAHKNECIYCGRRLRPGEKCICDLDDTYVINEFDSNPENYADDVEKRQCVFCGKTLYGTEVCTCFASKRKEGKFKSEAMPIPDTPRYKPPTFPPKGDKKIINEAFKKPSGLDIKNPGEPSPTPTGGFISSGGSLTTTSGRLRTTGGASYIPSGRMPHADKPDSAPSPKKPSDNKFFSKPKNL